MKVALIGCGTIGKRLVDALVRIPEIKLVGVGVKRTVPALAPIISAGVPIYTDEIITTAHSNEFCYGTLATLIANCEIVLDCTPRGTGALLRPLYDKSGVRVIYQGGEDSNIAETLYCSGIGFEAAKNARSVQVQSCNTTGLTRISQSLDTIGKICTVRSVLTRSSSDPDKANKGLPNMLIASPGESHHGKDIRNIWPGLNIRTIASYAPVNSGHLASVFATMNSKTNIKSVLSAFADTSRIELIKGEGSLADLRRIGYYNSRQDCPSVIIWRDGIECVNKEIMFSAGIHMESIVIPETLDVLFAMTGLEIHSGAAMLRSDMIIREVFN